MLLILKWTHRRESTEMTVKRRHAHGRDLRQIFHLQRLRIVGLDPLDRLGGPLTVISKRRNGAKARGLMNYIQDLVSGMAQKRLMKDANLFPGYSRWLEQRFADQWEIFSVSSDVADFGQVQWQGRPLDAVVAKTIVHEKNRIIGRYEDRCYLFGLVNDDEFNMFRDAFALDCSDTNGLNKWRVGERFQSQWNAD